MQAIEELTKILLSGVSLTSDQAAMAARELTRAEVDDCAKRGFLLALSAKGESPTEVAAFAQTFREYAINPGVEAWADRAIDVCGTGGDGSGTFNISTAVSFIVAAAGVPVFKHGNRSITSKCGSADLLEALGIRLDAPHEQLRESLRELNFCFFFAPAFHPAFKEIMSVRRALAEAGQRSIFNLLGPLINPGRPAFQLLGVYSEQWVRPMADALGALGLTAGAVVHGHPEPERGLDELSCAGENIVAGFGALGSIPQVWTAADAGLAPCEFSDLKGGDVAANLATMHALMAGSTKELPQGLYDSTLLNAGAALWISGAAPDLRSGVRQARHTLESGEADRWLARTRDFYTKD